MNTGWSLESMLLPHAAETDSLPRTRLVTARPSRKLELRRIRETSTQTPFFTYHSKLSESTRTPWLYRPLKKSPRKRQSNRTATANIAQPADEMHVHLGTAETLDCFSKRGVRTRNSDTEDEVSQFYRIVYAWKGSIEGRFVFDEDQLRNLFQNMKLRDNNARMYSCAMQIRVPEGMYVAVAVSEVNGKVCVYDNRWQRVVNGDFKVTKDNFYKTTLFVSSSNEISIVWSVTLGFDNTEEFRFFLRFHALRTPGLQVKYIAFNKGAVQTPLYGYRVFLTTPLLVPWAYVRVPNGHVIMVSRTLRAVMKEEVALYAADRNNATLVNMYTQPADAPIAAVYDKTLLLVQTFVIRTNFYGIHLFFSFHNHSARPMMFPDNSWNCSVPYNSDFLYHLLCNLQVECYDAEDEKNCSYTSDHCGPRYLTLGGACFFYMRQDENTVTWNDAASLCLRRGGILASLNTAAKWKDAINVLPLRDTGYSDTFVGLKNALLTLPLWYKHMYQWTDQSIAFFQPDSVVARKNCKKRCGVINISAYGSTMHSVIVLNRYCDQKLSANMLCERHSASESINTPTPLIALVNSSSHWLQHNKAYIKCPLGHYTQQFLACDFRSDCWYRDYSCESSQRPLLPSFICNSHMERISYSLVCDHRADCIDGSDEDFCNFQQCQAEKFLCQSRQCILSTAVCDGWKDCHDGDDESQCQLLRSGWKISVIHQMIVSLSDDGRLIRQKSEEACPHSHFWCLNKAVCLPMFLRCNGVYDCTDREDETGCDSCPGFYRCLASPICLHHNSLCDGHSQCPQNDDEMMCDLLCPSACVCRGLVFFCRQMFITSDYPLLRYLDASGSGMTLAHLAGNRLLIYLKMANCSLTRVDGISLPNLIHLDIEDNLLSSINSVCMSSVPQLRVLSVAGNPLTSIFGREKLSCLRHVRQLDVSRTLQHELNSTALFDFPKLRVLNLSNSMVDRIHGEGFRVAEKLSVIDLRGCSVTQFPRGMFQGLRFLQAVHAHNFKLCCPVVLPPKFNLRNCFAPSKEISSCNDLLRRSAYWVSISTLSAIALIGNGVSFIFRTFFLKRKQKLGHHTLVTHLSISDFLMGVYLAIIAVADQTYRGTYVWNDVIWRKSALCKFAGFLSLLSSEVSSFVVCLITLDRFLVFRFPFSRLRFSHASASIISVSAWICGVLLASIPLLPITSHWDFYSQTGICIPLSITTTYFSGQKYSFGILVVLNFVLCLFISVGQLSIYLSVSSKSRLLSHLTKKNNDLIIARRLIIIAVTDFLCWFPIGVLGLLAARGFSIPVEVNVATAVFFLPLNSAINPCLYTINIIMERRQQAIQKKLLASLVLAQSAKVM